MTEVLAALDASPLIIFHQIGRLELMQHVYDTFVAPTAVAREIVPSLGTLPSWVREHRPEAIPDLLLDLDPSEREAIALAVELAADVIVLDDLAARRRGLIEVVRPELDAMIANGLYVGRTLYREVLQASGELDP